MIDVEGMWAKAWHEAVEENAKRSPSFKIEDYSVTGRTSAKWGGRRGVAWWNGEEGGPAMVRRWIDWRLANPHWETWETPDGEPGIEIEMNIVLPGDIPVNMRIDNMFVITTTGELVVMDKKTGARTPETPEQLGMYAVGLELTYGKQYRPSWGFWWDANKGTHSAPLDLSMYTLDFFAEMYRGAVAGINAGSFLPQPANGCGKNGDGWCGVARYCAATGGPDAKGVDPLLPA